MAWKQKGALWEEKGTRQNDRQKGTRTEEGNGYRTSYD